MISSSIDTIAAIATPPGKGGVGIVRVSGPQVQGVAKQILGCVPLPRMASLLDFKDADNSVIDEGIGLFFPGPHSFTGEDVLELQGHGGPVVMDLILQSVLQSGVRLAYPGEFSERAFLNNKLDLTQAEAIADLIDASSSQAAKSAMRSLQGEFSARIDTFLKQLIRLRMFIEAAIDFPDEDIDFIAESTVEKDLKELLLQLEKITQAAKQGTLLQEGMTAVIAGKPNAGKSSLLNCLSGRDAAIVTDIAGTTRDVLREYIHIDGMPLHVIDTAGLRETEDHVEQQGVLRARDAMQTADIILLMHDATETDVSLPELPDDVPVMIIHNKIDLTDRSPGKATEQGVDTLYLSAKTGAGVELLKQHLKHIMGFERLPEGTFIARRRHLDALSRTQAHLTQGLTQLSAHNAAELLAEDCRQAQQSLSEITGQFTTDDLLGTIFSSFCIGK